MTIREAIAYIDETFPNQFSEERKTEWIDRCEKMIVSEIMLLDPRKHETYRWAYDADRELIAPAPYDRLYTLYLEAQHYLASHEASDYQNTMQLFNSAWDDYSIWYADRYEPAQLAPPLRPRPAPIETQVQGETITIRFTLPYDSGLLGALEVVMTHAQGQSVYGMDALALDGQTATLTLSQETTLAMPVGIWSIHIIGADKDGVRFESHEPMQMRLIDTAYPEVI